MSSAFEAVICDHIYKTRQRVSSKIFMIISGDMGIVICILKKNMQEMAQKLSQKREIIIRICALHNMDIH